MLLANHLSVWRTLSGSDFHFAMQGILPATPPGEERAGTHDIVQGPWSKQVRKHEDEQCEDIAAPIYIHHAGSTSAICSLSTRWLLGKIIFGAIAIYAIVAV